MTLAALCLAGIGVLVDRHRRAQRPLRPAIALLVDSFALGLVMFAALLLAGAFEWPSFETIRRITFGVIGIAPVAFLIGLLDARLARATVEDSRLSCRPILGRTSYRGCSVERCATPRFRSPIGYRNSRAGPTSTAGR